MLFSLIIAAISAPVYETPTMGWSSWNTYRVNINEELIKAQATAIVNRGLDKKGYIYINIDDGYFGGRNATTGQLLIHPQRFPNGLEPVVSHIHGLGLKAGIYSDGGRNTCGSYYDKDTKGLGVGTYGHDQQDADYWFRVLDFDFIKLDFCGGDPNQNFERLHLDERERYTAIRDAILNTGKKGVRTNVCRWDFPGTWVQSLTTSWRISADINPTWQRIKDIITINQYYSAYAIEGHYNDMDMLEVGRGMSIQEDRTHFGMWCILASPLLIGCDLTKITPATLELLSNEELIALNQDPCALQAQIVDLKGDGNIVKIFVKDIIERQGKKRAIAVYNPSNSEQTVTVDFGPLCLGGKIKIRDCFEKADVGTVEAKDGFKVTVPAHGTKIYTLEAEIRNEQVRYEAENAWLDKFTAIKQQNFARAIENSKFSCGGYVGYLGDTDVHENWMEWRDVYSKEGGFYSLTIGYSVSGERRNLRCFVNGEKFWFQALPETQYEKVERKTIVVELKKGYNVIRLDNPTGWAPDIDYIDLVKLTDVDNSYSSMLYHSYNQEQKHEL